MLFTSHNQETHRQFFDKTVSTCKFRKNTQLVFRAFLYEYENRVRIAGEDRGWWFNSVSQIAKDIGTEYRTIRSMLSSLKSANVAALKSANGVTKIKLYEFEKLYGIQNNKSASVSSGESASKSASKKVIVEIASGESASKSATESASGSATQGVVIFGDSVTTENKSASISSGESATESASYRQQNRIEERIIERIKEKNMSPDGDRQETATPSLPIVVKKKVGKKKEVNPLINPLTFLRRVEVEYPDVVLVWGRDTGAIKTLLSARLRAQVEDPQAEVWEMWQKFQAGSVDDTMIDFRTGELRRAYDIPTFVSKYALLRDRIKWGRNGKTHIQPQRESVHDKVMRWAEREEAKEKQKDGENDTEGVR